MQFEIQEDFIELNKLLKATRLVATGGHAKIVIENGEVQLNGQVEYRKRAKLRKGDKIVFQQKTIEIK